MNQIYEIKQNIKLHQNIPYDASFISEDLKIYGINMKFIKKYFYQKFFEILIYRIIDPMDYYVCIK